MLTALALSVLVPLPAVMLVLAAVSASQAQCSRAFAAAGSGPVGGVPTALIPLFQGAAGQYQLGPHGASILAAINYVESTFGQSNLPTTTSPTGSTTAPTKATGCTSRRTSPPNPGCTSANR